VERLRTIAGRPDWPLLSGFALALAGLFEAYLRTVGGGDRPTTLLLTLAATLPLTLRRTHIKTAIAATTVATLLLVAAEAADQTLAALVAQTVVLYLLAERFRASATLLVGVSWVVLLVAIPSTLYNVLLLACGLTAMGVGRSRRLGGRLSDVRADQAVLEERARIARELHDVVAHHVSTIAIQADTARLTTPGLPPAAGEQLEAIGDTARDAMTEMRRVLGVLRSEPVGLAPQPGLDELGALLDAARRAGTPVRLVLEGDVAPLPSGVELTVYRIVQEALTNARRHAPGAGVEVELRYGPDALGVRVRDYGPGPAAGGDGHGLLGMRERVATVGGSLTTGAADGGGFLVEASIPR
jgi:signal transduction histidine kinase